METSDVDLSHVQTQKTLISCMKTSDADLSHADRLERLETLEVGDNEIETLPLQFHELRKVKTLDLSGNKLTTVEMVSRIRSCEHLSVARNSLTVLPDDIHHLKNLVTLDVSGNFLKVSC